MSNYMFKPAIRESVGLLIGLIGPTGSGKTLSAMRIASGIVGPGNRFAVIDTESRRALHYADMFQFDHLELHSPFRPDHYADAIKAADSAGYRAIVVDSSSHEWAGEGGILDWQEEELTRMAGDDWKKRETCKMAAWIKPKMAHKQMVQRLLQTKAHLIMCFRAEEKTKIINPFRDALLLWSMHPGATQEGKPKISQDLPDKTVIQPQGFQPICSKELPYELTVSFLLSSDCPGIGKPLKLQEQHKPIFPAGQLLDESAGKAIAEWAKGGSTPGESMSMTGLSKKPIIPATPDQLAQIQAIFKAKGYTKMSEGLPDLSGFCKRDIGSSKELTSQEADDFISANKVE